VSVRTELVGETTLVATDCWCGIWFAAPSNLVRLHDEKGKTLYCPLGHSTVRIKSENAKLKEANDALSASLVHERDQREAAERKAAAARGQVTKVKNRVKNGVCPFCTRSFPNLAAHMETKHKDEHA
jgi:hypothetical protein